MAINESQKVDWLWKKLGYGVAKTDINSIKAATNESIASPLLIRGDNIWQDSAAIPSTKPTSSNTIVEIYDDSGNGSATIETTADATATPNRTWKTNSTDWISAEFGSTYLIKVYLDNAGAAAPQTTGTQLFAAGSGNNDEWYFDFQSGVLNFIGDNLPSGISGKKIYVVGARYIGNKGTNLSSANIGNFTFNNNTMGVSNANGDIILDPDGTGKLSVLADNVTITGNGALTLPVGTTVQRPTPNAQGMIRYNTTDSTFEGYDGANWGSLGGVKDVDQDTFILAESSAGADNDELDFYTAGVQRAQIGATGDIKFGNTLAEFTIAGATGDTTIGGDLTVDGSLQVNGSFTTVNSTTVTIDDPIFTLGGDTAPTLDDNKDRGIEFRYLDTTAKVGFFGYDDSNSVFTFIPDATNTNEVFSGAAGNVVFGEGTFTGLTGGNITIGVTDDNTINTSSGNLTINSTGGTTNITDNTSITGTLNVAGLASLDGGIDMDGVFTVANTSGNITTTGTLDTGAATLDTATVSDLTDNQIVIAGTSGRLEGDSNLTFNGTTFEVGTLFSVVSSTGNTSIGGLLDVTGEATLGSATISDLTDNRIVIAGTNGTLEDSANFTFDGSALTIVGNGTVTGQWNVDNLRLDGNSISSTNTDGNINITTTGAGEVIASTLTVSDLIDNRIVIAGVNGSLEDDINFTFDGTTFEVGTQFDVDVATGNTNIAGTLDVTSTSTLGVLEAGESTLASATVSDLTSGRITLAGTAGALEDSANLTFNGTTLAVTGAQTISTTLNVSGISTLATARVSDLVDNNVVIAGVNGRLESDSNFTFNGTTLAVTGAATISTTLGVSGESTLASATVSDLTDNRIVIAGTAGSLEDDANLTFNGTTFEVGTKFDVDVATGDTTVAGTLDVTGEVTLASAIVSDLTDNRIVIAGTNGALEDDANFTFNGTKLSVGVTNFNVDVATGDTSINGTLGVTGESTLASAIVSDLTDNRIILAGTAGSLEDDANFRFNGSNFQIGASGAEVLDVDVATGNTDISGTLTVGGNLQVNGVVTTINSTTVTIDDPVFTLGGDTAPTVDDNKDRGIEFRYFDTTAKVGFFGFDDSSGKFTFIPDATNTSEVFSGATGELDAKVDWNNLLNVPSTATANDFGTVAVTDTDTGYSWSETGSIVADTSSDTVTFVSGTYINIDADSTSDAIRIKHIDTTRTDTTSTQSPAFNDTVDIVSSITSNAQGHITAVNVNTITMPVESDTLDTVTGRGSITTNDISVNTLTSTVGIGTAPLTVTSTTLVNNLNADQLDGQEGSYYLDWTNTTNKPDPVITLGGDLSGSVTLTDLTSGTLNATINANSVALGTDTTGDYISNLVAGTGVTITNNTGETATPTVAIGQPVATTDDVTFNSITGPLTGNADTATTWQTGRTITLTGDVTGTSLAFDGSTNLSFATTIAPNSVELGTDTTGNYVATITGTANEIEVSGSGSEAAAITVGLPNDVTISNDLTVGNLTDNRIVIAGTSGILEDDANFTFDGTTFEVGTKFDVDVATGNTDVTGTLDVTGNTDLAANVTLGTSLTDNITINGSVASNIIPLTPDANDLGSSTKGWRDLYLTESVNFIGATSENEIVIPTNLGDGLSIKDTAGDLIVFKTSTGGQKITITPDLQLDGNFTINGGSSVTTILDEDTMVSDSATALATQQSIKAYVDNKNSTQDLDFAGDTGTGSITLDSQTFTISGTANEIETTASGQSITIGLPNDVTVGNDLSVTTDLTVGGNAIVTGDLTINGTTTTVNTTELTVTDNLITLNDGETGAGVTAGSAGIEIDRGTAANKSWIWDESTDRWSAGTEDIQAGQFYGTIDGGTF